jgi:hypothetical protein
LLIDKLKEFHLFPQCFFFDSDNLIIKKKLNGSNLYDLILNKNKYFPEEYKEIFEKAADLFLEILKANIVLKKRKDFFWDIHGENILYSKEIIPDTGFTKYRWYLIDLNIGQPNILLKIAHIFIEGKTGFSTNMFDYICQNYNFKNYPKDKFPFFLKEFNILIEKIALKVLGSQDMELIYNSEIFFNDKLFNHPKNFLFINEFKNCRIKKMGPE